MISGISFSSIFVSSKLDVEQEDSDTRLGVLISVFLVVGLEQDDLDEHVEEVDAVDMASIASLESCDLLLLFVLMLVELLVDNWLFKAGVLLAIRLELRLVGVGLS